MIDTDGILEALDTAEILVDGENPAPLDQDFGTVDAQTGFNRSKAFGMQDGDVGYEHIFVYWSRFFRKNRVSELHLQCGLLPMTDLGNAERFMKRFGANFKYVDQWGWLAWDGRRWNSKEANAIFNRAVHSTIKLISREAYELRQLSDSEFGDGDIAFRILAFKTSEPDVRLVNDELNLKVKFINPVVDVKKGGVIVTVADRLSGWCLSSQSNAHISCVMKLVEAYLTISSESFDADPLAFNVANGTLRFVKHESQDYVNFQAHAKTDLITKISEVIYDPKAACPVYDGFLARVQPDEAMRIHLHAWGGVSLTALLLARLSFWYGTGRNGKSTLIDAWAHVLGDYSQTIPIESFLDQGRSRRGGEASPDIASLPGIRCLRTSEPEKGAKLAESLVKLVTGGEPLRARHLNRDFFEFRPVFKLTMQGNYKPRIDGTDEGIWARILLVPWQVMIPAEERDVDLPAKLKAEASGILNRLLDGLRYYLDKGLTPPDEVLVATAEYREDSDPIGRFLTECTVRTAPAEKQRSGGKELWLVYKAWASGNGERAATPKGFSRGLQDHGVQRLKSSGIFYLDIIQTKFVSDFEGMQYEDDPPKKY